MKYYAAALKYGINKPGWLESTPLINPYEYARTLFILVIPQHLYSYVCVQIWVKVGYPWLPIQTQA
jgi:hypothetical protein